MKKIANKKPLIISNCIYALLLAVVIAVNCVAVYFGTALDLYFGTVGGQGTQSEDYSSDYASAEDLVAAQEDFANHVVGEGSVLLKNEGDALPLASGAAVTLFGAEQWYNTGSGSGAVANQDYADLTPASVLESAGCNAVNMDFINDEAYGIDACLWAGATGSSGIAVLGDILNGTVNPSGHLVDTYLYNNMDNPAAQNFGEYLYEGTDIPYVNYIEGIYVGYRYFETRYEDQVMGTANVGNYNYDKRKQDKYKQKYDNMEEFQISEDDQFVPGALPHFVNYVEGIYVGYRFYETAALRKHL